MRTPKLAALILAAALQLMPVCRVVTSQLLPPSSPITIMMQWVVGAIALLGTCHAVSGASTVITSPLTASGTNGVAFSYRITCGPEVASSFNAAPLPSGLTVNTSSGRITGTPTSTGVFLVTLTASGSGHSVSAILNLTIVAGSAPSPPAITTQPQSQTVTAGGSVSFTVAASGTAPLSYQWRLGNAILAGNTTATLGLTGVTTNQAGIYTVVVANSSGSVTSSPAVLTVTVPVVAPTITTQPQSQTVTVGASASFSVTATGTGPLSYQWRLGGVDLPNQTAATLLLIGVTTNQPGSYSVVVSNSAGWVLSSPAVLTVTVPAVAPTITTQPRSQTVTAGANAGFSMIADGTAPLSYQWRLGNTDLAGQTAAALQLTGVTTNQAGSYSVVVGNSVGSVTSSPAVLTVIIPVVAPTITMQPQSQNVIPGANVSFSVAASGTAPLSYQWWFGNTSLTGQTGATLSLTGVTTNQAGSYLVVVSNSAGSVTSSPALLTVNPVVMAPSIAAQPQSQTVSAGASVSFSVVADGTGPLGYQWRFGNASLADQTNAALLLSDVTTNQSGSYTVIVSNSAGTATSSAAILTVNPVIAPIITTQPQSLTVTAGADASFSVAASGTSPLTYEWLFGNTTLAGQTSSTLALSSVTTNQAGIYRVVVSNSAGSVTSSPALLAVQIPVAPPTITTQPQSQSVTAGQDVSFLVSASGTAPLGYQWRFGDSDLPGEVNPTLSLTNVATIQAGSYSVLVTNSAGSVTSAPAVLTVSLPVVAPTITTEPLDQIVTNGANASFSVTATGTAPLSYQWRFGGIDLPGEVNPTLLLLGVTSSQAGSYTVLVGNPAGAVLSRVALLTILQSRPDPNPSPTNTVNQTANWPSLAGRYSGLLYDTNGVDLGSSGFFTFNLSRRGTYSASVQLSGGWKMSASGTLAADGTAANTIILNRARKVNVTWQVDLGDSDQIAGIISDGNFTAQLAGDRAVFSAKTNPCPKEGKYTFILPGTPGGSNSPEGDGYGTISIDKNGMVTLKGYLPDKKAMARKVPLAKNGEWPLYVPLYSGIGALLSWVHFEDRAADDFHGALSWIKPAQPLEKYYPSGFLLMTEFAGSRYIAPADRSAPVLDLPNGVVILSGGELTQTCTNELRLGAGSIATDAGPNQLKVAFTPSTGLFKGSVVPAGATSAIAFRGAALQKANLASGFFLAGKQAGRVLLQNAPPAPATP